MSERLTAQEEAWIRAADLDANPHVGLLPQAARHRRKLLAELDAVREERDEAEDRALYLRMRISRLENRG